MISATAGSGRRVPQQTLVAELHHDVRLWCVRHILDQFDDVLVVNRVDPGFPREPLARVDVGPLLQRLIATVRPVTLSVAL